MRERVKRGTPFKKKNCWAWVNWVGTKQQETPIIVTERS